MAPSDSYDCFVVGTGHCRNAVNPTGGHFLSSLFSLLSFLRSLPSSLLGANPFLRHTAIIGMCGPSRSGANHFLRHTALPLYLLLLLALLTSTYGFLQLLPQLSSLFALVYSLFSFAASFVDIWRPLLRSLLSCLLFLLFSPLSSLFALLSLLSSLFSSSSWSGEASVP